MIIYMIMSFGETVLSQQTAHEGASVPVFFFINYLLTLCGGLTWKCPLSLNTGGVKPAAEQRPGETAHISDVEH